MSRLKEGEYIKNPKTGRLIKVGGRTYKNLVRDGIVEAQFSSDDYIYELKEEESYEQAKKRVQEKLPRNRQAVKGRGIYKGHIVTRHIPLYKRIISKLEAGELDDQTEKLVESHIENGTMNNLLTELTNGANKRRNKEESEESEESDESYESYESEESEENEEESDEDDGYYKGAGYRFKIE